MKQCLESDERAKRSIAAADALARSFVGFVDRRRRAVALAKSHGLTRGVTELDDILKRLQEHADGHAALLGAQGS